jgi:membrane protease YdiL (CAAX protease family)
VTPSRRLGALLCAAVVGLLVAVGLVVLTAGGPWAAVAYAVVAVALLRVAVVRGRSVLAPPVPPPGRTCTCCTTSQLDPVRVV